MSLTLDSNLSEAQDEMVRSPLCRIISSKLLSSIPFEGNYFNYDTAQEEFPTLTETSDGRLASLYTRNRTALVYKYSDTNKIEFTDVVLVTGDGSTIFESTLVELAPGVLGILYCDVHAGNSRLRWMKISDTGTILGGPTTIEQWAYSSWVVREVHVIKLQNETYLAVYKKSSRSGTLVSYFMKRTSVDFETWSAESEVDMGLEAERAKGNPFLFQVTDGDVLLFFDYVTDEYSGSASEAVQTIPPYTPTEEGTVEDPDEPTPQDPYNNNENNYVTLPHQFDTQVADETKDESLIRGYLIDVNHNPEYRGGNKIYPGFRFFIPPGIFRISWYFTTTALTNDGPSFYAATRFYRPPTATLSDFTGTVPDGGLQQNAPKTADILPELGFLSKRASVQNVEEFWIMYELNWDQILPSNFKTTGGWVYVNFWEQGGSTVYINSFQGVYDVSPEIYNAWQATLDFTGEPV